MIAYVMLYMAAVGVPVFLAAAAVAAVLRRYGKAERMVWLAGLGFAFVLPVLGLLRTPAAGAVGAAGGGGSSGSGSGVIGLPEILVIPEGSGGAGISDLLLALWLGASALLALRLLVAALRLARAGRSWRADVMDGVSVWMTDKMGPAVSGLIRPRVLVPSWLADMPAQRRSLVLLHEQEHIRAGDPWLMLVSRLAPVVAPWNPVVWLLSARLLRAIELDCDRRVLRHRPDVRTYGHTLIEISSRDSDRLVAVAAFAESEAPLRSRILNMTTPSRAVSIVALLTSMVLGVVLMVAAFEIPVPTIRAELTIGPEAPGADAIGVVGPEDRAEADASETGPAEEGVDAAEAAGAEEPVDAAEVIDRLRADPREAPVYRPVRPTELRQTQAEAQQRVAGDPFDVSAAPTFTPFTVAPVLRNMQEVQRALVSEYPTVLRDSGIGGRVLVWFFIDEQGLVQATQINQTSGFEALDQAALNVASVYRFSPALNRENPVPVWVALPITFQVR